MTCKLRFAPSPTGYIHVGNVRIALINWLFAHVQNGHFLLRMDDTDQERSEIRFEDGIQEDMEWLGLAWNSYAKQSDRMERYQEIAEQLRQDGRLYPCYETEEELQLKRKVQLSRGLPPIYDRESLRLSPNQISQYESEGRKPHWRFKLRAGAVSWNDLVRGQTQFEGEKLSDPVLIRHDGVPLYTFCSVVDDADMGITHILRGEDHVTNTAIQIQLFEAIQATIPEFGHLSLITDISGQGLSKRDQSLSIRDLRARGFEPMAINSYLARMGTSDPIEGFSHLNDLIRQFDLGKFGRASPKFSMDELIHLNQKILCMMPASDALHRLKTMGLNHSRSEAFWNIVRQNITVLKDAQTWWDVCFVKPDPVDLSEHRDFLSISRDLLPPEPWDATTWKLWTQSIHKTTNRKGKELFLPLRLALTGRSNGPELHDLILLMGRSEVLKRLG